MKENKVQVHIGKSVQVNLVRLEFSMIYDTRQSKNTNLPANKDLADKEKWVSSKDGGPAASLHQNTAPKPKSPDTEHINMFHQMAKEK